MQLYAPPTNPVDLQIHLLTALNYILPSSDIYITMIDVTKTILATMLFIFLGIIALMVAAFHDIARFYFFKLFSSKSDLNCGS